MDGVRDQSSGHRRNGHVPSAEMIRRWNAQTRLQPARAPHVRLGLWYRSHASHAPTILRASPADRRLWCRLPSMYSRTNSPNGLGGPWATRRDSSIGCPGPRPASQSSR